MWDGVLTREHTRMGTLHRSLFTLALAPRPPEIPPGHPLLEGVAVDTEETRCLGLVPARPLEDAQDDLALEALACLLQRQGLRLAGSRAVIGEHEIERKVLQLDDDSLHKGHRPLDDVL